MAPQSAYATMLSPLAVGARTLRNRVIMGSMHTRLETEEDAVRKQAAFYAARARGEAALVITGGFSPNAEGIMEPGGPRLDERPTALALRPIVEAVHAEGALICAQLLHAGRYAKHPGCVGPSPIRAPITRYAPRALSEDEILATIADFASAAQNAEAAGFDGVELMGGEGYLINQFTVPHTNHRTDRWGGSMENRHRLPVAVVRAVRAACGPDFLIIYRLSAADLIEGGAPAAEIAALARAIEAAGASIISTGVGWHEARVPTIAYPVPRGAWRQAAAAVKAAVSIPVVASNRINVPELAEDILARGDADLVALARPMLADPEFVAKVRAGRAEDINTCIACNQACLDYIFSDRTASCLVNPRACRESEFPDVHAAVARRIAVVGAGAAGLSAAVEAARLGHAVTLFEAGGEIGGQLKFARMAPGKVEFNETLRYFRRQLDRLGVEVRLNARPDAAALSGYDHVVVATGVTPRIPDLPGITHPKVATYDEILCGAKVAGERVAIIGAGGIGFDVAEFLVTPPQAATEAAAFYRTWGVDGSFTRPGALAGDPLAPLESRRTVTLLQRRSGKPGQTLGVSTGWILRNSLRKHGVRHLVGVEYLGIDDAGLHVLAEGGPMLVEADTVVICAGQEPQRDLHAALCAAGIAATLIGGAKEPAELDALRAIRDGLEVAQSLR